MKTSFDAVGDVREVDLLAAFVELWRSKRAGLVSFSRAGASAAFALSDGDVVSVSSSEARFESSAILVRAGKLDAAALERLSVSEGADGALAALQAGVLTKREWRWGEKIRGIEVLADLLGWPDGKYHFDAEARPAAGEFTVAIPRLLLELFLRSRDRNLIEHQLGSSDATLVRTEDFDREFATFGLTADAESVVRMIDGKATADEIARGAPADEFAVRKLLAALMTLGLLRSGAGRAGSGPTEAPDSEPAPMSSGGRETAAAPRNAADAAHASEKTLPDEDLDPGALTPIHRFPEETASEHEESVASYARPTFPTSAPEGFLPPAPAPPQASEFDLDPTPPSSLESYPLPAARSSEDVGRESRDSGGDPLFEPLPEAGDAIPEDPKPRGGGVAPLVWVIVGLGVLTGAVLFLRSRAAAPGAGGEPAPAAAATSEPAPTSVPAAVSAATAAPPAVAPALPAPSTAVPVPAKVRPAAPAGPRAAPALGTVAGDSGPASPPAPPAPVSAGRSEWVARAARDRARLKKGRTTRYAVQLELACEVPSLAQAWKHDRPAGSMWLLANRHGSRDCFRVLWGRYPTLDAARKARTGIPAFFSTPSNHPAIVSVP
ncbi:MAG: DUF4388 domain-containing protein [Acidobacteriota bacterium]